MADSENIFEWFQEWSLGDAGAYAVMKTFHEVAHVIDDFVDGEVLPDDRSKKMLQILETCLIQLPNIPFYATNSLSYQSVVLQALLMYDEANRLQDRANEDMQCVAYIFRGSEELIYYHTAYLLGGLSHAETVKREYRQLWMMNDSFADWKEEHL